MANFGLAQFMKAATTGGLRLFIDQASSKYVGLRAPASIPGSSFNVTMFSALPASLNMVTIDSSGNLGFQAIPSGGAGGITSIGLSMPTDFSVPNSPLTANGTLTVSRNNQNPNLFLASPLSGAAAAPSYRGIGWQDVSGLAGTSATSFALGNDSRFHTQNTDQGTNQSAFIIGMGGANPIRISNNTGTITLRNSGDTANTPLTVGDLTVTGNFVTTGASFTTSAETIEVADNEILLNSNVTAATTPTENGGVRLKRGTQTDALFQWNETTDKWEAGIVGTSYPVPRIRTLAFTSASLSAGKLSFNHGLNNSTPLPFVWNDTGYCLGFPDDFRSVDANTLEVDLTNFTVTNTWTLVVAG